MYIRRIEIENIKNFDSVVWDIKQDADAHGWHVILGDNGAGKSTFIKAISLLLMGPELAPRTQSDFTKWVKQGSCEGRIVARVEHDSLFDRWSDTGRTSASALSVEVIISSDGSVKKGRANYSERTLWGRGTGWFSSSFGPFRRFTGGDQTYSKLFYSYPDVARHLSAFNEAVALTETLEWLKDLRFKQLEDFGCKEGRLLDQVIKFINDDNFLPNGAFVDQVTSKGVVFKDAQGSVIDIEDASDGHRSILSLMIELIRQMTVAYNTSSIFSDDGSKIVYPGVVLVDEIDAHLHPRWQRSVGQWLCKHFPRVQFMVTTHSPLVCQNAINGSVFQLSRPGREDRSGMVSGERLKKLIYGNVLEAYSSGVFGDGIERSDRAESLLNELAELNVRARRAILTREEKKRRSELQAIFPTEE
ncbi:AAA family ATPase [Desulfovibrio sp. JY]|nr:AAA family ATPase [Desulfovibrio sp. JY]